MKDTVVVDIETLGTLSDSVIMSVGMVAVDSEKDYTFEELLKDGYYAKLDVADQVKSGRKIYKDTLEWWGNQGEAAKHILAPKPDDMKWRDLMPDMIRWLKSQGVQYSKAKFYSRGSHFDFGILNDLFRRTGDAGPNDLPWRFWNLHDAKTVVLTLLGEDIDVEPEGFIYHDCLHDAAREYLKMEAAVYKFQATLEKDD